MGNEQGKGREMQMPTNESGDRDDYHRHREVAADKSHDDDPDDNVENSDLIKDIPVDELQETEKDIPADELQETEKGDSHQAVAKKYNFIERESMRMARNPCLYFWISFLGSLAIGAIGMIVGNFEVAADNNGWNSRGTNIADRQTQMQLVQSFQVQLHDDTTDDVWLDLINNIQKGWESDDDSSSSSSDDGRRLSSPSVEREHMTLDNIGSWGHRFASGMQMQPWRALEDSHFYLQNNGDWNIQKHRRAALLPIMSDEQIRLLDTLNNTEGTLLEGCNTTWYTSSDMYEKNRLWPIWRTKSSSTSFFDANVLEELCLEEQKTQSYLEKNNLCQKCQDGKRCIQPYSTVFYARLTVDGGMSMSCQELAAAWEADGQDEAHKNTLDQCVGDLLTNYNVDQDGLNVPASCPYGFFPTILDELYPSTERARYSSSIFATTYFYVDALYDSVDNFAQGNTQISGVYDTQYEDFVNMALDEQLLIDMSLAVGSAFVTVLAMVVHTRSPFLSIVGLAQIVLSFPLSFFFYTFVAQLDFFPFLNFIGIFVIFALGADDVFVAVDKWRNARLKNPDASVEEIAAIALPDAAMAMLLTSLTTAVAFFGTAVCPVAPILCFAVFCGMLVVFDYILCILLVFPALCIYDKADHSNRCCCHCRLMTTCKCTKKKSKGNEEEEDEEVVVDEPKVKDASGLDADEPDVHAHQTSKVELEEEMEEGLIHKILRSFYKYLYMFRWPLLVICGASLVWCAIVASQIALPESSDVRLYNEDDNQYEKNFVWRKNLLFSVLEKKVGSEAFVVWGLSPADTGDRNNPDEWSQLVLDPSFNPSDTEAQRYLLGFCDRFFAEDFATPRTDEFVCPINAFDIWIKQQFASDNRSPVYTQYCNGAEKLPMPEEDFGPCMYHWSQEVEEYSVLARQGKITVMYFPFSSRVRYDSPFDDLNDEWHLIEDWMNNDYRNAPASANGRYFSSEDFWWYDTNKSMLNTAFQSAGIAMGAAAAVILFSSRSVVLTIFATVTVGYVLTSVTAMLVAMGWELGFLESILFAILIGVSCDFVIHFSHAYSHLNGHRTREERTLHALLSMGPSVLAAAFTTFSAALVMLFTVIIFFQRFAVVLFLTIIQSLAGSFVVFLTMTVTLGPSDPTYLVDHLLAKCCPALCGRKFEIQGDQEEAEEVGKFDSSEEDIPQK
ncbi:hypothetical protein ACA910_004188 [Epithemia clementina (nom. ined.)]